ncbi:diacylglyceryl transferase [Intrasporangium chromatireducens Q5-1]|uniref:Diacylglyceryl transferase n=1 Tax=Intrasporangium chromatireducens Q5-1 TaxID=584657 RepID=W9GSE8_9MICO|nr:prolipoprotein diacylglyceryl transferase family protein [Intrasporangium chromatireducens]EWT07753.1 diacylglyceryl transferase [Intrasporangium chromatireducens Q5-1]
MIGAFVAPAVEWSYSTIPTVLGISPHGLLSAVGILLAWVLLRRTLHNRGLDISAAESAVGWAIPAGLVGARIDYVVSHPGQFGSLWQMLEVWRGGMALFGGLLGGVLGGLIVLRRRGARVLPILDAAAAPLAAGIAIGRVGDLMLSDHLGRPLTGTWGIGYVIRPGSILAPGFSPSPARPPGLGESCRDLGSFYAGCTYHLTPAYDLIAAAAIALVLVGCARWTRRVPGVAIGLFALLYAGQRLALDGARGIDERPFAGLTGTQLIAVIVVTAAAISIAAAVARHRTRSTATTPEAPKCRSTGNTSDRDGVVTAVEPSGLRTLSTPTPGREHPGGDPSGPRDTA